MSQNNGNNFLGPLGPLVNGCDTTLAENSGTLPSPIDALRDMMQQMTFTKVGKVVNTAFVVQESATNIMCYGVLQPHGRTLAMTPSGQRKWRTYDLWTDLALTLQPDDVVTYLGVSYRVLVVENWRLYSFMKYSLTEDFTGSSPQPTPQ